MGSSAAAEGSGSSIAGSPGVIVRVRIRQWNETESRIRTQKMGHDFALGTRGFVSSSDGVFRQLHRCTS